ncbi:aspartyl/asparaginyl beta-hydroxylase domain-containing protein [Streptomyces sp. NPDC054887]
MDGVKRIHDPLGRNLPDSAELTGTYDTDRLHAELARLAVRYGSPLSAVNGRRVLPLYSLGGDPHRTDPGGPSLQGYKETSWLSHLPAMREILEGMPAPLRSVRLVELPPGVRFTALQSPKMGPPWGLCRLHLPITSGERARTFFVAESHTWRPGTLWFAAAWRAHALVNDEPHALLHLIIDMCHTAELGKLFPAPLRDMVTAPAALVRRPEVRLTAQELLHYQCRFPMPEAFTNWEQPGHHFPRSTGRGIVTAEISMSAGTPRLVVADRLFCSLEHIGQGEFRMRGWSDERTLQVDVGERHQTSVVLRAREGCNTYSTRIHAASGT